MRGIADHRHRTLRFLYEVDDHLAGELSARYPMAIDADPLLPSITTAVAVYLGQLCLAEAIVVDPGVDVDGSDGLAPVVDMLYGIRCWKDGRPLVEPPRITSGRVTGRAPAGTNPERPRPDETATLLLSGGKDSTLSALRLLGGQQPVQAVHLTANVGVEGVERRAAGRIAAALGLELLTVEVAHPGFHALADPFARNWNSFPLCNAVPFGRDLLTTVLALPVLAATGSRTLAMGHDRECRNTRVTHDGRSIPRNDIESEEGATALERFIRREAVPGFELLAPVGDLDELTILRSMLVDHAELMRLTSFCFWGTNCGRCAKCLRYHLAQRLFLDDDLLHFEVNPFGAEASPELRESLDHPADTPPGLFHEQILYCIGMLQREHRLQPSDRALLRIPPATQARIDDIVQRLSLTGHPALALGRRA